MRGLFMAFHRMTRDRVAGEFRRSSGSVRLKVEVLEERRMLSGDLPSVMLTGPGDAVPEGGTLLFTFSISGSREVDFSFDWYMGR